MARNRGKKPLYEVMSNARAKQGYGKTLEQLRSKKTEEVEPVVKQEKKIVPDEPAAAETWRKKPKIAQFNAGRFEFSVPYQVAIVLGMALLVILLGSYRLGQRSIVRGPVQPVAAEPSGQVEKKTDAETTTEQAKMNISEPVSPVAETPPQPDMQPVDHVSEEKVEEQVVPDKPKGGNVIVLAHSGRMVDLEPVVAHFAEYGIELQIDPLENGQYQLRTVQQFESNPATPGTDGFRVKSEIIRVGPLYKGRAPAGLDTFAPHYFTDAYGKNVDD